MVSVDVVDEDGVLALRKRMTASLREERGREDARVLSDEVALRADKLNSQALNVVEVKPPAELLPYQFVGSILVRSVERFRTDEHEDVRVVLLLAYAGAVAIELPAPVSPHRISENNASTMLINPDDGVATAVSCATQRLDARYSVPASKAEHSRSKSR